MEAIMDLTLLHYFHTVAREGSFMAAAEKLGYAQSNLSMRIKQLEEIAGTELLIRGRNGVTLTERGQVLYSYADKLLALSEEAESAVKGEWYSTGRITIAAMESAAVTFLPGLLAKFHRKYLDTSVKVITGTSDAGVRAVLANNADMTVAVGENSREDLSFIPLRKEELVLVTDRSDQENDLKRLLARPLLVFPSGCAYRRVLERMLIDYGIAAVHTMEFTSLGAIQEYLRNCQPRLLAIWGKEDPSFIWQGAEAFRKDLPNSRIVPVSSGHFALENCCREIAEEIIDYFAKKE